MTEEVQARRVTCLIQVLKQLLWLLCDKWASRGRCGNGVQEAAAGVQAEVGSTGAEVRRVICLPITGDVGRLQEGVSKRADD